MDPMGYSAQIYFRWLKQKDVFPKWWFNGDGSHVRISKKSVKKHLQPTPGYVLMMIHLNAFLTQKKKAN